MLKDNGPLAVERQTNTAKALGRLAGVLVPGVGEMPATLAEGFTGLLDALGALVEHRVLGHAHAASWGGLAGAISNSQPASIRGARCMSLAKAAGT